MPPTTAPSRTVTDYVLVENLEIPWDIAVAPDGDVFVTERVGRVNRFDSGELREVLALEAAIDASAVEPGSAKQPWWIKGGEGGTLGVALHPEYPDPRALYVYYTMFTEAGRENRVSRFDLDADDPGATEEVVIDGIPGFKVHNGGRLEFGPDGYLWALTGTAAWDKDEGSERAADPESLAGKVLRVTTEGDPAPGNPDLGVDADPRVFTYGHRNPQGIVWLPDGTTIATEHGPEGYDEVNRLVPGGNYGWPDEGLRTNPSMYADAEGIRPPLATSGDVTWAPSGSLFYTGADVPSWRNRMLIGGLISQQIIVVTLTPPGEKLPPVQWFRKWGRRFDQSWLDAAFTATAYPVLKNELGRVRQLAQGPDGELYAITSNRDGRAKDPFPTVRDDVLVKLTPK